MYKVKITFKDEFIKGFLDLYEEIIKELDVYKSNNISKEKFRNLNNKNMIKDGKPYEYPIISEHIIGLDPIPFKKRLFRKSGNNREKYMPVKTKRISGFIYQITSHSIYFRCDSISEAQEAAISIFEKFIKPYWPEMDVNNLILNSTDNPIEYITKL